MISPSEVLYKISPIIGLFKDPETAIKQLGDIIDRFDNIDSIIALVKIIKQMDEPEVVSIKSTYKSEEYDVAATTLKTLFDHNFSNPDAIVFDILNITKGKENLNSLLMNLKNCIKVFAAPSTAIKQLSKYAVDINDENLLFFRKVIEPLPNKEENLKLLLQIFSVVKNDEFLIHLSRALPDLPDNENFIKKLAKAVSVSKDIKWEDVFTHGQMESKKWLISELQKIGRPLGTVFILGGWIGSLAYMMQGLDFAKIRSFDIDPNCEKPADKLNMDLLEKNWSYKAQTKDMFDIDYHLCSYITTRGDGSSVELEDSPDTIINTSSEHIDYKKWQALIPKGKLVVVQNNNFLEGEGHINCYETLDEFVKDSNLSEVLFAGQLELPQYNRYMIIGVK